jgi:ADP-ribosyl-[dinitrogen reductase] hydrolase
MSTPLTDTQRSRVLGSYYGSLVGDALGAPYEFKTRDSYAISSDYVVSTTFGVPLPLGGWTDDSSMMLCLLESFLECGGTWNADDCVRRWVRWMSEGYMSVIDECFDIGTNALLISCFQSNISSQAWPPRDLSDVTRSIWNSTRHCPPQTS